MLELVSRNENENHSVDSGGRINVFPRYTESRLE